MSENLQIQKKKILKIAFNQERKPLKNLVQKEYYEQEQFY